MAVKYGSTWGQTPMMADGHETMTFVGEWNGSANSGDEIYLGYLPRGIKVLKAEMYVATALASGTQTLNIDGSNFGAAMSVGTAGWVACTGGPTDYSAPSASQSDPGALVKAVQGGASGASAFKILIHFRAL